MIKYLLTYVKKTSERCLDSYRPKALLEDPIKIYDHSSSSELPSELNIAVWNIFKGNFKKKLRPELARIMEKNDLLLLQEVVCAGDVMDVSPSRRHSFVQSICYRRQSGEPESLITCSTAAPQGVPFRVQSLSKEPIVATPKSSLITQFRITNSDELLTVVNVHFLLIKSRKTYLAELENITTRLRDFRGPMVVAGDFNTYLPRDFKRMDAAFKKLGLKALELSRPKLQLQLDHVYTRGFACIQKTVAAGLQASDHHPILLRLELS